MKISLLLPVAGMCLTRGTLSKTILSPTPTIPGVLEAAVSETPSLTTIWDLNTITDAPSIEDVSLGLEEKYHMTTYYSCVTLASQVHCGTYVLSSSLSLVHPVSCS